MDFLCILLALLLVRVAVVHSYSSKPALRPTARQSSQHLKADPHEFAPQFNPTEGAVSLGILTSFGIIQTRIRRSIDLAEQINALKKEINEQKSIQLSGSKREDIDISSLEDKLRFLSEEELNYRTFVSLPGLTLRFRTPASRDGSAVTDTNSDNSGEQSTSTSTNTKTPEESGVGELLRISFVAVVVLVLLSVFQMLMVDPMSSTTSNYVLPG